MIPNTCDTSGLVVSLSHVICNLSAVNSYSFRITKFFFFNHLEIVERVGYGGQDFEKSILEHETGDPVREIWNVRQFQQEVFGFVEDAVRLKLLRRAHRQQFFVGSAQFENLLQCLQINDGRIQVVHG